MTVVRRSAYRSTVTVELLVTHLDHAARQAIGDWQRQHRATGGTVQVRPTDELIEPGTDLSGRERPQLMLVEAAPGTNRD